MYDILDYQAQHYLRQWIDELPPMHKQQLKNIRSCGLQINRLPNRPQVVYVVANELRARFVGQSHCDNPFCCPVCTARRMEYFRSRIASALDMLKAEGYIGFMVTFTVPHLKLMKCREVTDILYNTWKYFRMKNFNKDFSEYQRFNEDVPIAHWIRVCEYTYGENGWHPHFHCVFWTKRENTDKVLAWEQRLNDYWMKIAKFHAAKVLKSTRPGNDEVDGIVERLFCAANVQAQKAVKFSVDMNGKLLEAQSSDYITGWGADQEATGNIRKTASHSGHYTPHQILLEGQHDPRFKELYIDYCLSVTQKPVHHRADFSQTGICKRIDAYQDEHGYETSVIEKKTGTEASPQKVLTYFDVEEWYALSEANRRFPVFANILYLATRNEDVFFDYLASIFNGMDFRRRMRELHLFQLEAIREVEDVANNTNTAEEVRLARRAALEEHRNEAQRRYRLNKNRLVGQTA